MAIISPGIVLFAQEKEPTHIFRIYEDNDCLNLSRVMTDNAYTNGTSLGYYYLKEKSVHFFADRLLPKSGKSAVNIFNWKLTQLMVTPTDISKREFQPDDYPYAGALFFTHGLTSYNPLKKYSFSTQIILGIRGPASGAEQLQKFIHRVMDFDEPKGWDNQLKTSPLVNLDFTAEKQLWEAGRFLELIGGAKIAAGSFIDAFSVYPLLRIGKMAPYFEGMLHQSGSFIQNGKKSNAQFFLLFRPVTTWVIHDALFYGQTETNSKTHSQIAEKAHSIRHRVTDIQYGAQLSYGRFSVSYLLTHSTAYSQGLYKHDIGNITASVRW